MAINARSPHIVLVDNALQTGSKIEIDLWYYTGTQPTTPTYTLSKLIPSSTNTKTYYNISAYIREFLTHKFNGINYMTNQFLTSEDEYVNIQYRTYNFIGGVYVLDQTVTDTCFDGYGLYEEGVNIDRGNVLLGNGTSHYYWDDSANNPNANPAHRAGIVTAKVKRSWYYVHTPFGGGTPVTYAFTADGVFDIKRVHEGNYATGNTLQIFNNLNVLQWTGYFYPKTECRYEPMTIDFINKFGGWQREFFFKASQELLDVNSSTYNLMPSQLIPTLVSEGQRHVMNSNGTRRYLINTGWVDESYGETIQELLLSERVIWQNGVQRIPVKVNTKSINKFKNINQKTINYQIEIELAFDVIHSVI
jgi:hypothetical protein